MADTLLHELETATLTVDLPDEGLSKGDLGTVVMVVDEGVAYKVEFADTQGRIIARVALRRDQLRRSTGEDG
jgi:hypothetical protein